MVEVDPANPERVFCEASPRLPDQAARGLLWHTLKRSRERLRMRPEATVSLPVT